MNEAQIAAVLSSEYGVSRETVGKLQAFVDALLRENHEQNLIAQSTVPSIWDRHILDCAQLMPLAAAKSSPWLDAGSGPGLPGMVLAIMSRDQHVLVESRRRRADFLLRTVEALGMSDRVRIVARNVDKVAGERFATITARAFSRLSDTLASTVHLADRSTTWLLHKGRTAADEVAEARGAWNATFAMIPSRTDPAAAIVRVTDLTGRAS